MNLAGTKALALSLMFVISFLVGILPIKVRQWLLKMPGSIEKSRVILSAFLCFGAGVLLGTTFLHILPETLEEVEEAQRKSFIVDTSFALGELVFCCGFFFMYIVEEAVHFYVHNHSSETGSHHSHNIYSNPPSPPVTRTNGECKEIAHANHHELQQVNTCNGGPHTYNLTDGVTGDSRVIVADHSHGCHGTASSSSSRPGEQSSTAVTVEETQMEKEKALNLLRSIFVMLALSIHGCLEGFALGLETHSSDVWLMFGALTAHKVAIAFSLGMELLENEIKMLHYVINILIFSLASPIGGTIGALVLEYSDPNTAGGAITTLVLQGLSGGTIMFVIFCEILERERCKSEGRLWRMLTLILGFILMACLELVGGHEDGEEDQVRTSPLAIAASALNR